MIRLRIGDRSLRLRDEGGGESAPLVCIHGAGTSSVLWLDVMRRLGRARRLLAPDLPGHGQSDPWPGETSVTLYRDAVGTMCATLGLARAVLAGHSMGAQIALACAAAWPERVQALVLVAGAANIGADPELMHLLARDPPAAERWFAERAWSKSTPRETRERLSRVLLAFPEVVLADLRAVQDFVVRPLLERVRAPALVLGGEDDRLVAPEQVAELAAALPGARLVLVPGAGHMAPLEQPAALGRAVESFLSSVGEVV